MLILFDDARPGAKGPFRLYRAPRTVIRADHMDEVRPALARLREALKDGGHAAGYLAYEAGYALDEKLARLARKGAGPLVCFGIFDAPEMIGPAERDRLLSGAGSASLLPPEPRVTKVDYQAAVRTVRSQLLAGEHYQANLTFGNDVLTGGDPLALYVRLRKGAAAAWGGVLVHEDGALVSLSPEQFFTLKSGRIHARPMKGTAPRHQSPEADRMQVEMLVADEKQRAENLMIVDLLRNDLARVAETGSVSVPRLFAIEHYPTLHQMVSDVNATLRSGLDAVDIIETIFPCGSVTGAPKIAAMEKLRELEPEPRGAYTGSMGWIEPPSSDGKPGDASFNVLIRTIEIVPDAPQARLGLGSGLVVDSEPEDEWAECRLKGEFVTAVSRDFDLIETMRYDPSDGIAGLEAHLERMMKSAAALGFAFDRHEARNELQAATFGKPDARLVRLMLSPSGAMAIELRPFDPPSSQPLAVTIAPRSVRADDFRLRFKTSDRHFLDSARKDAGTPEVLFEDEEGYLTEGSWTNLFVEKDGHLVTPPLKRGLLPGILRAELLASGRAVEGDVRREDLSGGFHVGNAARGLMPAQLA
ncbi:aminodeoxychorismate synthase component I [Sphingomicrobium lutaoense]|uniref:Probable branched-chain-amino-acid aminotransferase n=1 Tax=Sphingomicrobium lutaoense TaxID=515949 RepID=A0A839YZ29_9SPHN|nr:aminodeoxychorismate synthase component I [Sphingomicrobium lutaoense]MBB3763027.1 para-aminobenzoate synthetase/4-amino-4-deoxychorismate lyase [Sphingomicrobium lutaoense]